MTPWKRWGHLLEHHLQNGFNQIALCHECLRNAFSSHPQDTQILRAGNNTFRLFICFLETNFKMKPLRKKKSLFLKCYLHSSGVPNKSTDAWLELTQSGLGHAGGRLNCSAASAATYAALQLFVSIESP